MLFLRVYATVGHAERGRAGAGGARQRAARALAPGVRSGHALLTAEVHPESADPVLEFLLSSGVAEDDIALARLDEIAPVGSAHPATSLIWADVLGQARRNARPVALYLAFTIAAGVIAAFGVIEVNSILIVGAMAVSPDMLPRQRGLRRPRESPGAPGPARARDARRRAWDVVPGGRAAHRRPSTCLDLLPADFVLGEAALSGLTTVNSSTIGVAFAAGSRGHPRARDARELGRGRGHLRDDDSGRRLCSAWPRAWARWTRRGVRWRCSG